MMRGAAHWAVAVRCPDRSIWVESHEIDSVARRHPFFAKPFLRGIIVLGQSLVIGTRALMISTNKSAEDDRQLSSREAGVALGVAMVVFIAVFIVGPTALFHVLRGRVGGGTSSNVLEGVFRVVLFVGYLWGIGRTKDIGRVYEYHGAEHMTIAAWEHGDELDPAAVEKYPKEHVRCGTNFLIIVMIITILVFSFIGTPGILWRIGSRLVAIPVIAGLAYEALRLGARFPDSLLMRALMAPGIWLQHITTRRPDTDEMDVAIASFREVLRREGEPAGAS
jgi:uncharacterized protein YqhQ